MSDCKTSRVSRELFNNIKSFLHHKLKTMIRIQSVNDLQLVLKWQDRVFRVPKSYRIERTQSQAL
ncbi:hypothetical protein NP0147_03190 [Helicobacter pylori]